MLMQIIRIVHRGLKRRGTAQRSAIRNAESDYRTDLDQF
jgi:hypothetical protein